MIEANIPEISVDEIMARIREEVAMQKQLSRSGRGKPGGDTARTVSSPAPIPPVQPLLPQDAYVWTDFLSYHDSDFIENAYRSILRRAPDTEGAQHYLSLLHSGGISKIEVLGRLRYSKEGRNQKIIVKGLWIRYFIQMLYKVPVAGRVLRIFSGVWKLPVILKNIQVIENTVFIQGRQNEKTSLQLTQFGEHLDASVRALSAEFLNVSDTLKIDLAHKAEGEALVEVQRQLRDYRLNLLDMQRRIQLLLEETRKRLPAPISTEQMNTLLTEEDHFQDALYVSFEDRFRGTREDIKGRVKVYLPYIKNALETTNRAPVLDVGCGRGEWLEVLKENEIVARGVDLNRVMAARCRELGLEVMEADVMDALSGLKNNTLSAVTGLHIIEHLPLKTLLALFDESLRVLKPGGMVIFETPNPENILVGACTFYTDPTHRNPLPPQTSAYLIEARGFVGVEIIRLHQNPAIHFEDAFLDAQFATGQDYAVIGHKA
ncbi:MAG: methyltransferase domain-containing protein [Desulfobacterales bacterium]|jgi:O-antigen chain-terminating methyltransferase|nr:methyltransferase domain-containing protein [Desulfobacterales bacterium]